MVVSEQTQNNTGNLMFRSQLSEFLNNNIEIQRLDSESTIDISNIIVQDQTSYHQTAIRQTMPISDLLVATSSSTASNSRSKPALVYLQNEKTQDAEQSNSSSSYEESESTCDYEEVTTKNGKRKAANIGNSDRSKRISTTSTTSSSFGAELTTRGRGGRRGARIASSLLGSVESGEDTVARFGNKTVIKGTEEYNDRRNKNNDAVKKCRAKLQEKQTEREKRLKELSEENRKLTNTVDSLNKELNVLKGILSTMKPQYTLPSDIEEKIKKLESMILANNNNSKL